MSSTKVIFTYKRKRLSSCSGAGNDDVCPNFSSDVHIGKHQAAPKESSEKGPMHRYQGKELSDSSCPQLHGSIGTKEKYLVQRLETFNAREMQHRSTESSEDNNCKVSGKSVSTEATSLETTKASCLDLDSSCILIDGSIQGGLVLLQEEPNSSTLEVSKSKMTAPLLTFSRRLKRKAESGISDLSRELPSKEGAVAIEKSRAICVPPASCDDILNKMQVVEKSSTLKVATDSVVTGNTSCQSREKIPHKEAKDSSYLCTRSSADIPALRQTVEKKCSQDDLMVNTSSVTKQSASVLSGSDALETTNLLKNVVLRSSDDELSSCDDVCKTDEQHVSIRCRTSSGDSQLTSTDCSDVKTFTKKAKHTASSASLDLSCPPSGAFVIDCNVIPESDLQEKESDTVHHSSPIAENRGKITQEGHLKRKGLELLGDTDLQVMDSPSSDAVRLHNDLHAPVVVQKRPETKYLQLFSEDGQSGQLAPSSKNLESGSRRAQQNTTSSSGFNMGQLELASRRASAIIGLSLAMEPIYDGQTSRHGSGMHPFQDHNVGIREFIQNPAFQSFPDQTPLMFQHKVFPDTCNTRATALRGNRNISLDRFESGRTMWSEEELDSLWIGIRRHGRGNWHAMLLDPKLRFAPWRVALDLATQWDREQCNLLTGQHVPEKRCLKPPDAYNSGFHGRFMHPRSVTRDSSETHLSLGDVYARKEGIYFGSNGQNQSHIHVTLANSSFNPMHTSVMIEEDSMGLGPNSYLPHWLRDPTGPTSRYFEPSLQMSTMPPTGGPQLVRPFSNPSGSSSGVRNLNNYELSGTMPSEIQHPDGVHNGVSGPSKKKQSTAENVIVIDSDATSEETISDDHNMRN